MTRFQDATTWGQIGDIRLWIDKQSPAPDTLQALGLRLHKMTEELGEVALAYSCVMGSDPRKGRSQTEGQLAQALCDAILAGQVALATLVDNPSAVFSQRLPAVHERSLGIVRRD
ncbi:MazG-like family protein [Streptomyces sp. CA-106131]|uniref:MazG-like family protein n=1 Tax=Streptomyces sp. CA-106131 TaxID=3240045 RepID=UPI003D9134AC